MGSGRNDTEVVQSNPSLAQDGRPPSSQVQDTNLSRPQGPLFTGIELQPKTRPISLPQLVKEVQGIYIGLVMVETKCIEVDSDKGGVGSDPQTEISNEQWQALITLHRTLLHEHHDFMLASQHPSASPALRRLAQKYAMPARMWRHGIHSFLELLRHRLPESQEHMITFICLAYSMVALLYETVPAFEDTWVECLGDLSRYRMAIEDDDQRLRGTWTQVSTGWYTIASNHAPTTGRLYHHLAILARPNVTTQLFLYFKSLCVPIPFTSTRESIMTLLDPILSDKPRFGVSEIDLNFTKLHAIIFTGKASTLFGPTFEKVINALDDCITTAGKSWIKKGAHIASIHSFSSLGYGDDNNVLMKLLRRPSTSSASTADSTATPSSVNSSGTEPSSDAQALASAIDGVVFLRLGDTNCFGYMHVRLIWLLAMAELEGAMVHLENHVPWPLLVSYTNDPIKTYERYERLEQETIMTAPSDNSFAEAARPARSSAPEQQQQQQQSAATTPETAEPPRPRSVEDRPIPEDWALRGMIYTQKTFPKNWFAEVAAVDDGEGKMEKPAMTEIRKERILWLAVRLARFSKWMLYDVGSHQFSVAPKFVTTATEAM